MHSCPTNRYCHPMKVEELRPPGSSYFLALEFYQLTGSWPAWTSGSPVEISGSLDAFNPTVYPATTGIDS